MVQNSALPSQQLPITHTLVICEGRFGRSVGFQLAARLKLMEDRLRQEGKLASSDALIARVRNNNEVVEGKVRIMQLQWADWRSKNLEITEFLRDLEENVDASTTLKDPQISQLDPDTPPSDVVWTEQEGLRKIDSQLRAACLPLRLHTVNNHQGVKDEFRLRLILVCAAREPDSAIFTHDLIRRLGDFYITNEKLTSGIQMFCYVGGTSLEEHMTAGGSEKIYALNQHELPGQERRRVLGSRRKGEDSGLLEQLMFQWNSPGTEHLLETCYLVDSHLENGLVPIPGRLDEPAEVVIATALAIMSLITTNADLEIRQMVARHSKPKSSPPVPGTPITLKHCSFASFGVASYTLDHPRLHWLIHSWLMGDFLSRALPLTKEEIKLANKPQDVINDIAPYIEVAVRAKVSSYQKSVTFNSIDARITQKIPHLPKLVFSRLVELIDQKGASTDLKSILAHITIGLHHRSLEQYLQDYKLSYIEVLRDELTRHSQELYKGDVAPLMSAHYFLRDALAHVSQETAALPGTFDPQNALHEQQNFTNELEKVYQVAENNSITVLATILQKRPTRANTVGRALLMVAALWVAFPLSIPLLAVLVLGSALGAILATGIHSFYILVHRQKIRSVLVQLARLREQQLLQIRQYAQQWGLVDFKAELEEHLQNMTHLCEPRGLIATLRDELLEQDLLMKDHTLERLFLDKKLKQELKQKLVDESDERLLLWNRREHVLSLIIDTQQPRHKKTIDTLIRHQVEALYQGNTMHVTDIISHFLAQRSPRRLDEIHHTLSHAAIPFLQYKTDKQDDSIVHLELFGANGGEEIDTQDIVTQYPRLHVVNNMNKLCWLFIRVHVGIHFDQINFSIARLAPP